MSQCESSQQCLSTTLDAACAKAMELQRAGQRALAEQLYRSILGAQPAHGAANFCLGMLNVQSRQAAAGLPYLVAALNAHPEIQDYWLGYLDALLQSELLGEARDALALGRQHGLSGAAVEHFAKKLAALTRRRSQDQARDSATLQTLIGGRRLAEAILLAHDMTRRFPDHGPAWKSLGALLWWEQRTDEALIPMQRAVELIPHDAEAHSNLGMALYKLKRLDEALRCLKRALEIDRNFAPAHYHLGMTHLSEERYAEAAASLKRSVRLQPDYLTADAQLHSDLLFLSSHDAAQGATELFTAHCRYGDCFEASRRTSWPRHANLKDPARRLKLGLVSGDFNDHPVGSFLEPLLSRLHHCAGFELHAYYNNERQDLVSARLRGHVAHWHAIAALSDQDLAHKITNDGIDILVDLSGHTGRNRLRVFAHKPAPIQVSWLGYPGTTGLRAMDYYLGDEQWLPPGEFAHQFTEKLVYMPDRWIFQPHADAGAVDELPALKAARLTFGSFNRVGKINAATLRLWASLLRALPTAALLLGGMPANDAAQRLLIDRFAAEGVARERLTCHERSTMYAYLALHGKVDLCLDTQPYAGGTTTMHALSMGVPTLTIAGPTSFARAGAGILAQVGLTGFTATDATDFVAKGVYWASHLEELAVIRRGLRQRVSESAAGQADLFATQFERMLRQMWTHWCAGLAPVSFHSPTPVALR